MKKVLTREALWDMERVAAPTISPDGRQVVFTVTSFSTEDNKSLSDLWLISIDGLSSSEQTGEQASAPRRLTWHKAGSVKAAQWSPDGRYLAFISRRGNGPAQLYRLDMAGGEAEPLTEFPVAVGDFRWFPDGRRIAFVASTFPGVGDDFEKLHERVQEQKDDKTKVRISDRRLVRYWDSYRTDGRVLHLFELEIKSRKVRDLMPDLDALMAFRIFSWDLSPGGDEIAYGANSTDPPWRELKFDIHLLNVETGARRNLTGSETPWCSGPRYTPDGRYLLFGRTHRPKNSADFTRLARHDRESGETIELMPEWDAEAIRYRTTRDGQTVVFHSQNRGRLSLFAMPIDGGTPRLLVEGGCTTGLDLGPDHQAVFVRESLAEAGELAKVDIRQTEGEVRQLTVLNRERFAELDMGQVEEVIFEGADGDPVQMWVMLPPGFDPSRKWPLLLILHGGPHSAWGNSFHYRWNTALFAAQGWVVAAVNFHGSTGFGQAFAESIVGNHPEKPFEDAMKATDLLIDRGYIDEDRMAAAGGSFGGFMISWILGHTDRFAALVNHAGVYDLMAQYASDYTWSREVGYGAAPWEDPGMLDRASPSRFAKNFTTPTLILHGELDYRVPVTHGINLHHVLTGKGVPSRIVIFPKENHWILKPQAAEIWWREVLGWLDQHIGQGPSGQGPSDQGLSDA